MKNWWRKCRQGITERRRLARAARRQRGDDALVKLAQFALCQLMAARPESMNPFKLFRLHSRSDRVLGRHAPLAGGDAHRQTSNALARQEKLVSKVKCI